MFDVKEYQARRNAIELTDKPRGYPVLGYVVVKIGEQADFKKLERYETQAEAEAARQKLKKKAKDYEVNVVIRRPKRGQGERIGRKRMDKAPNDKQFAAGTHLVRIAGQLTMTSRKASRQRAVDRSGSKPNGRDYRKFSHPSDTPLSKDEMKEVRGWRRALPRNWQNPRYKDRFNHNYPPEMTQHDRVVYRRDMRQKRIEAEREKAKQESTDGK